MITPPLLSKDSQPNNREDKEYKSFLESLPVGERLALAVTKNVGTLAFFVGVLMWTVLWCGYNILATEFPRFKWQAFDPFPAFVAWLLISNVIQLHLMPLILIGQNLDAKRAETQAKKDFHINKKAEKEIRVLEAEITHIVSIVESIAACQGCEIPKRVHHLKHEEDVEVKISED